MEDCRFNCGVIVGRFSPLHIGHEMLIKTALNKCKEVVVVVTSNDKIDKRNPYSLEYRCYLINKVFYEDISSGNLKIATLTGERKIDKSYGDYVLQIVKEITKKQADFIIYGNDKDINKCFSKEAIEKLNNFQVDRNKINVSATDIRKALKNNDNGFLKEYLNPLVYEELDILSNI